MVFNLAFKGLKVRPRNSAELLRPERIPEIDIYVCHSCLQGLSYKRVLALYFVGCFYLHLIISCSHPCCFPSYCQLFDISRVHQASFPMLKKTAVILFLYFNTLRTGSFKLFKRPFPGFLTILTL